MDIESALESNVLDKIIVSTDDESIANFSRSKGLMFHFSEKKLSGGQFTHNGYRT